MSIRSVPLGGDATVNDVTSAIPVTSGDVGVGYDFGELPPATLSGSVFEDLNNDGVQDPGELGVAGVEVTLAGVDDLGNLVDVTVVTDADGNYVFADLRPSDATGYTITETQPAGLLDGIDTVGSLGGDATVNDVISGVVVAAGDAGTGYDFAELPPASLAGTVFEDLNNDGVVDAGEPGIAGVDVTLTGVDELGNVVDVTVQTDADGNYVFEDLRPADAAGYTITETQPATHLDGVDSAGSLGGDATVNDVISAIPVAAGDAGTDYTFGEALPASLAGTVYEDLNNNGVPEFGEPGIAGVDVTLTGTDAFGVALDVTVQTDVDGNYLFANLPPSDAAGYTITETQPAAFLDGLDAVGSLGGDGTSTMWSRRFRWSPVTLASGTTLASW